MNWPPDATCKRICALWALAYGSTNVGESTNALAALKRLQSEFDLSDVELAFIAEYTEKEPVARVDSGETSERPINVLELILHLLEASHIILRLAQAITVALWTLHARVYRQFLHTPRLLLRSFEPGCGKTALLSFMKLLIVGAVRTGDTSAAAIYHRLQKYPDSTFLLDEIENSSLWDRGGFLRRIIDEGHRYDGTVARVIRGEWTEFPVFAPLALAAAATKKRFPPQVLSRAISIEMEKHREGRDEVLPDDPQFVGARALISEWAPTFKRPEICKMPFVGRDTNNWKPLIEIGQALGYGATARAAAFAIHRPSEDPVIRLMLDTEQIFDGIDRIWTSEYLSALHQLVNARWDEFLGLEENQNPHPLTHAELYSLLRTKGIKSRSIRKGRETKKGFLLEQFEPVWHELFGDTPAQSSKIIGLPWHKQRHAAGTE